MNQDNQVGWEKEFDEKFLTQQVCQSCNENPCGYHTTGCRGDADAKFLILFGHKQEVVNDIKAFISRVAQDSYAEGIRRAIMDYRKASTKAKQNGGGALEQVLSGFDALIKLEEEVKK